MSAPKQEDVEFAALRSELEAARVESDGRLRVLNEKAEEARREWQRAEAAEARATKAEDGVQDVGEVLGVVGCRDVAQLVEEAATVINELGEAKRRAIKAEGGRGEAWAALMKRTEERDIATAELHETEAERDQARKERDEAREDRDREAEVKLDAEARCRQLEAECVAMRGALETFKAWADKWHESSPNAATFRATDQYRAMTAALSGTAGAELLAERERLKEALKHIASLRSDGETCCGCGLCFSCVARAALSEPDTTKEETP